MAVICNGNLNGGSINTASQPWLRNQLAAMKAESLA